MRTQEKPELFPLRFFGTGGREKERGEMGEDERSFSGLRYVRPQDEEKEEEEEEVVVD